MVSQRLSAEELALANQSLEGKTPQEVLRWAIDKFELVKINPLLSWTKKDVWAFIVKHDVPYNPLHDRGYPSIGCWPCTRAISEGEDERAGRWSGSAKKECGLHIPVQEQGSGI